jgi:hypothetical protein
VIQFLQPIWLWAMTAIAVPLFIHLWNIRQGKTLKVGSIAFLTESTRAHSRSLRISELLLLLLRCLLLIMLALLLSNPVWIRQTGSSKEKGWVLIAPEHFTETYTHFKPAIDSLLKAGFTLHRFEPAFAAVSPADTSAYKQNNISYWQLVQELNQQVPASMPLYIFTDNRAVHFTGKRPPVSLAVNWYTLTLPDSASNLIHAFISATDSIRIITQLSKAGGNRYTYQNSRNFNNQASISDTAVFRICIYTDTYTADAGYLKAAVHAIRDFTQRRLQVIPVGNAGSIPPNSDWLFWLSDKPLPENITSKNTLAYATGNTEKRNAVSFAMEGIDLPVRFSTIIKKTGDLLPVWSAGNGDILLGKEPSKNLYHFYSRFNPQWNGLVWSSRFPEIIYKLIGNNAATAASVYDMRALDPRQVAPETAEETKLLPKAFLQQRSDLSGIFWILAFVFFLAERLFTYYSKRTVA